ncbi:Putative alpha-1,2-mannosidase [Sphingomonas paucimobilis]|nr:Putative alpha-1,2-mannosidase [Sphingomonas paucimobilis]
MVSKAFGATVRNSLATLSAIGLILPMPSIAIAQARGATQTESLADLVNPLMGTDSDYTLSYGNTYPAVAVPWGMNFWSPVTGKMGSGWGYTYHDKKISGIKQTHQPSPWMNDYAAFEIMAETGPVRIKQDERASWFSHKAEESHPYKYKVYLADHDVTAEVVPTSRAAQFRFTFPQSDDAHIVLDAYNKGSMVTVDPQRRRITGYVRNNSGGVPDNFHNYFVLEFDHDFVVSRTWDENWQLHDALKSEGGHVGAVVSFKTRKGEQIGVKVASSFISAEQAERNLTKEIGTDGFAQTEAKAKAVWDKELGRVRVIDPSIDNRRTFYSALYRMLQFPRRFYEYDARGRKVHYSPMTARSMTGRSTPTTASGTRGAPSSPISR